MQGALFEVELVRRAPNGPLVAMKRVARRHGDDADARFALVREAELLALVRHPAVPALLEVGADARGPFVVEEAVRGVTVEALLERHPGSVDYHLAAHVVSRAARALREIAALADDEGPLEIVLGDPSPANLMVDAAFEVRFVDFGASRYRGAREPGVRSTGTAPYAAPELCRGEVVPSRDTDVYALAAVAVRLLTQAPLRPEGDEAARLVAVCERGIDLEPLLRARVPKRLKEALVALVAFDRASREVELDRLLDALDPVGHEAD